MNLERAERTTILRAVVGSTMHGLNVSETGEDRDEMGVCIEDIEHVVGLTQFEQIVHRTAAEREQKHNAKSQPGDLDLVIYGLRKFIKLALKGNPTILCLLFIKPEDCIVRLASGAHLQELTPHIVSKQAGKAFLGYLQTQRQRLLGQRGQLDVHRPDLVEKYGYDTKYAMHMLRLGCQGVELLITGKLSEPMNEPDRLWLRDVRLGKYKQEEVLESANHLEEQLRRLLDTSKLRDTPDYKLVEEWMVETYFEHWKGRAMKWRLNELQTFDRYMDLSAI